MPKIAKNQPAGKPRKPTKAFPLFPHATGRWAKKVRGQLKYFGKVADDPKGEKALALWLEQRDDLLAGRTPRGANGGLAVHQLSNLFLATKESQVDTLEITRIHWESLHVACDLLMSSVGKNRLVSDLTAADFDTLRVSLAKTRGAWALGGVIQKIRSLFKWGYESDLIEKPIKFGPTFRKPGKAAIRREKADKPLKLFESKELRTVIHASQQPLTTMIMLAINCGFGNSDCGHLQFRHLDLKGGWIDFPRPKTGADRRCPLWPETVAALQDGVAQRPTDKDDSTKHLVFLTKYRQPWTQDRQASPLSAEFRKLLNNLKLYREGLGFYAIRHTFATVGADTRDQIAVNALMGHVDGHISAHYRERISDERLVVVSEHVRGWLFPHEDKSADEEAPATIKFRKAK